MAEGQEKGSRAVFWELGLAIKEKDPTDPTGKRYQAICKCKMDKDDPTITCNKKIGENLKYLYFVVINKYYLKYLYFVVINKYFLMTSKFP